jgi:parvulin-like peptidyl-prolyl isomerase
MQIRASHILVPNIGDAILLKKQIDAGASFEDLAKQHSKCPSGKNGGDLGFFGPGRMVHAFDTAARALTLNQVSDPVVTQFGHHLIKRTG